MEALLVLALLALPASALYTLGALALVLVGPRSAPAIATSAAGVLLTTTWTVLGYRAGVHADETGGSSSVFDLTHWLVAATGCSTAALLAARRRRRGLRADSAAC